GVAHRDELHVLVGSQGLHRGRGAATAATDQPDFEEVVPRGVNLRRSRECGRRGKELAEIRGHRYNSWRVSSVATLTTRDSNRSESRLPEPQWLGGKRATQKPCS